MYIFVCKYVCIAVVCLFGVGSYGLASTEAGATPASLVVISHLPPSVRPSNNPGGISAKRIAYATPKGLHMRPFTVRLPWV